MAAGRALDLGSGSGRNALYLARHGWDTVGVEIAGQQVDMARRAADRDGVTVRFVHGDVTRLAEIDLGGRFDLLMDGGCYHMISRPKRPAYADGVTRAANPGALLIMVGFTRLLSDLTQGELEEQFSGWKLRAATPVGGQHMSQYVRRPAVLRAALRRGLGRPWRFEFSREL